MGAEELVVDGWRFLVRCCLVHQEVPRSGDMVQESVARTRARQIESVVVGLVVP